MFKSKLGCKLCISYLAIFMLTGIFGVVFGELAGIYMIIVTLPWSTVTTTFFDSIGYINWYSQFNGIAYGIFAIAGLIPAALLNAFILHFLTSSRDKKTYITSIKRNFKKNIARK